MGLTRNSSIFISHYIDRNYEYILKHVYVNSKLGHLTSKYVLFSKVTSLPFFFSPFFPVNLTSTINQYFGFFCAKNFDCLYRKCDAVDRNFEMSFDLSNIIIFFIKFKGICMYHEMDFFFDTQ